MSGVGARLARERSLRVASEDPGADLHLLAETEHTLCDGAAEHSPLERGRRGARSVDVERADDEHTRGRVGVTWHRGQGCDLGAHRAEVVAELRADGLGRAAGRGAWVRGGRDGRGAQGLLSWLI